MNVIISALQRTACILDTLPCLREDDETANVHDQNLDPLPRALNLPKKLDSTAGMIVGGRKSLRRGI